ncbi:uncharacterized protein N7515_007899 [Penicillium bovifimosum]|uniref:Uncharacterized protein n=1 Tax=Penicillium bovifimosum TaxID=126998 RepID=A0A9W9KVT8_9EURO|nr:uncharacterized protein N7515_007899 [Penicillium bovifimosum]KAJ5124074.1 hypothetical protein N7515_007899 [Penicillium bovifimosum]
MSRCPARSIASAGSESAGSPRQRSSPARGERSASNPASYIGDRDHYDTALPSMDFRSPPMFPSQSSIAHRRTGSTLKTVMRKIFNRKRQSQADELEETPFESSFGRPPVRNSGPAKGRSLAVPPALNLNTQRSSPLSAENLQLAEAHLSPLSPLHSGSLHEPLPGGMPPRRRRATLPSVVFSDDGSRYGVASTAISDPQEDRSYVPDRRHSLLSHRLSRSTEALREMADQLPEIPAEWSARTASAPGPASIRGSPSPPLDESSNSGQSRRPSTGTTVTNVTPESAAPSVLEMEPAADQASLPNVAHFVSTMQQDDNVTLEQRLTTLEVKLIDLEFAIARMQTSDHDKTSRPRHPASTGSLSSRRHKPAILSDSDTSPLPSAYTRPSSTSTIRPDTMNTRTLRPAPSATSLSDYNGVSIEQYSTLVTLLRREQTARRNLEAQVGGLRDDIRLLQRATMQPMRLRRDLSDSGSSPRDDKGADSESEWDRSEIYSRDDPFGQPKWERQRVVTAPMI